MKYVRGFFNIAIVALVELSLQMLFSVLVMFFLAAVNGISFTGDFMEELTALLTENIFYVLGLASLGSLLLLYAFARLRDRQMSDFLSYESAGWGGILSVLPISLGMRAVTVAYVKWAEGVPAMTDAADDLSSGLPDFSELPAGAVIFAAFVMMILAPIVEEIMFRGFVFFEARRMFPLPVAIVVQGLLFGLMHMNIYQFGFTFIFGIFLGILYYERKNIRLCMACHIIFNISAAFAEYITAENTVEVILFALGGLVAIILGIVFAVPKKKSAIAA